MFCCAPSYRAEKSRTRRHLAEYTHFEGELGFITYADLLDLLEDMCVDVAARLVAKAGDMLKIVNPNFVAPQKPFLRMDYGDAVKYWSVRTPPHAPRQRGPDQTGTGTRPGSGPGPRSLSPRGVRGERLFQQ